MVAYRTNCGEVCTQFVLVILSVLVCTCHIACTCHIVCTCLYLFVLVCTYHIGFQHSWVESCLRDKTQQLSTVSVRVRLFVHLIIRFLRQNHWPIFARRLFLKRVASRCRPVLVYATTHLICVFFGAQEGKVVVENVNSFPVRLLADFLLKYYFIDVEDAVIIVFC